MGERDDLKYLYALIDDTLIEALRKKINNLNEHKNYQIDENRKISRRVDELEAEIDNLKKLINSGC